MKEIPLADGRLLRVEAVLPSVFRVRLRPDGDFREPGLVRYDVIRSDWPPVEYTVEEDAETVTLRTAGAALVVSRADGRVALHDAAGATLVEQPEPPRSDPGAGFDLPFALRPEEKLYGLGDETRERIQKRGHKGMMVVRNVTSYAPIPFLMSTGGWAVFLNTTWFHSFDAGATDPDVLRFRADRGELDYYLVAGATLPELLDRYTQVTGRPHLLPLWGYGLTFVCDDRNVRARDVLYEAHTFRREGVPCDLLGLEPEWMETYYDFSVNKKWSPERFHFPAWLPGKKPGGFPAALANMGFRLSLWLCCDYDVSEYEEQLLGAGRPPLPPPTLGGIGGAGHVADDLIQDPHFRQDRRLFDTVTKPGEPWFEHLKKFVDDGAEAFKMDGSNQVLFHPDRRWRNGMEDAEMHNLYPVLLAKQMALGYREHTGRRAMIYTACGYAGIQRYAATWAGDTGGGEKPLVSLLNHGLSGHANVSCDMQVWSREGIHFGFFQPWCQILSWHQYNQPWFLEEKLYEVFREYARLRYRLLPYFYSAAHEAARTGLPVLRAMPLVAPDDPRCEDLIHQYLVGDAFLTAAFTETIYLPAGTWVDYWTGETYEGPKEMPVAYPENRGGPLFVRAGAIIPTYPDRLYMAQAPFDPVGLEIFPQGDSSFTLTEDDGVTDAYLEGKLATTVIGCRSTKEEVTLHIGPRAGSYEGMPERRHFEVRLHLERKPSEVLLDDKPLPEGKGASGWRYDLREKVLLLTAKEDPKRRKDALIRIKL